MWVPATVVAYECATARQAIYAAHELARRLFYGEWRPTRPTMVWTDADQDAVHAAIDLCERRAEPIPGLERHLAEGRHFLGTTDGALNVEFSDDAMLWHRLRQTFHSIAAAKRAILGLNRRRYTRILNSKGEVVS